MKEKSLSIVTPTYNRGYILNQVYDSLKNQTVKNFVWIIIDDGSTDNTNEIVDIWKTEGLVEIKYFKKTNGGKASSLNYAADKIKTEYCVCLDSDDIFTNDAVYLSIENLEIIKSNNKYCGILALRNDKEGVVLGDKPIPESIDDVTLPIITNKYKIRSEYICFYKTSIIKKYKFPVFNGEKFVSPGYLQLKIGRDYYFKASREQYCICEYLSDGLTQNKIEVIKKNPRGYTAVIKERFALDINLSNKVKNGIMYVAGSIISGDENFIKNSPNKIMTIILYPMGWLAYKIRFK